MKLESKTDCLLSEPVALSLGTKFMHKQLARCPTFGFSRRMYVITLST